MDRFIINANKTVVKRSMTYSDMCRSHSTLPVRVRSELFSMIKKQACTLVHLALDFFIAIARCSANYCGAFAIITEFLLRTPPDSASTSLPSTSLLFRFNQDTDYLNPLAPAYQSSATIVSVSLIVASFPRASRQRL